MPVDVAHIDLQATHLQAFDVVLVARIVEWQSKGERELMLAGGKSILRVPEMVVGRKHRQYIVKELHNFQVSSALELAIESGALSVISTRASPAYLVYLQLGLATVPRSRTQGMCQSRPAFAFELYIDGGESLGAEQIQDDLARNGVHVSEDILTLGKLNID